MLFRSTNTANTTEGTTPAGTTTAGATAETTTANTTAGTTSAGTTNANTAIATTPAGTTTANTTEATTPAGTTIAGATAETTTSGTPHSFTVYDIGLGTALNALATLVWQQEQQAQGLPIPHITYHGIEKYPILLEEALQLNFVDHIAETLCGTKQTSPAELQDNFKNILQTTKKNLQTTKENLQTTKENLQAIFEKLHSCAWETDVEITPHFTLHKHQGDITTVDGEYFKNLAVVMYDTFSPATQPQLWDVEIFRKIARNAAPGTILTTYCSKGTVKQALRDAGFQLERLSGPPGKRHILRATK